MDLTNKQLNLRNAKERTVIIRRDRQHRESIVGDIKVSIRGRQIRILSIVAISGGCAPWLDPLSNFSHVGSFFPYTALFFFFRS